MFETFFTFHPTKLPVILNFLDVNSAPAVKSSDVVKTLIMVAPLMAAYCWSIDGTVVSTRDFLASLYDWWSFDQIAVQASDESVDSVNRSRTDSGDRASNDVPTLPQQLR